MTRSEVLTQLIEAKLPIKQLKEDVSKLPWDSDKDEVTFEISHPKRILYNFLDGKLKQQDVEEWANLIECREDIGYYSKHEDLLRNVIHELANPRLTEPLTEKSANRLLESFVTPLVLDAFEKVHSAFPNINREVKNHPKDIEIEMPEQEGLVFKVTFLFEDIGGLNELRLWADGFSSFWVMHEPDLRDPEPEINEFLKISQGILSGKYRIQEYMDKNGRVIKAELQEPIASDWKTLQTYHYGWDLFGLKIKSKKVIQNVR